MGLHRTRLAATLVAGGLALACGAPKGTQTTASSPPPAGNGQLALSLIDAPATDVSKIVVNVKEVNVHHSAAGWTQVKSFDPPLSVDLLTLKAPNPPLDLGIVNLPAGKVTQIRLVVTADGNYVVLPDGTTQKPLKVPSGTQSGIKIIGPWDTVECQQTAITLDFDGEKSIWKHPTGHDDLWILRPVIKVNKAETVLVGCAPPPQHDPVVCQGDTVCATVCQASADPAVTYCAQPPGSECVAGPECASGTCVGERCGYSGTGGPCFASSDCRSGKCDLDPASDTANKCLPGDAGTPCGDAGDCASGVCGDTATPDSCVQACDTAKPAGESCDPNGPSTQCLSGLCLEVSDGGFQCAAGAVGSRCLTAADCGGELSTCTGADGSCPGTCDLPPSAPR